jgi:hypothetical protein
MRMPAWPKWRSRLGFLISFSNGKKWFSSKPSRHKHKRVTIQKKAKSIAFLISLLYVGIGTIKLLSIVCSDGMVFDNLGEKFEKIIIPSYFLGFAFGYGGGVIFAVVGQLILFGSYFVIVYGAVSYILRLVKNKSS